MKYIICKRCNGTGKHQLAPSLVSVYRLIRAGTAWTLGELRKQLIEDGSPVTSNALSARLAKLVDHGLLVRSHDRDGYAWSRS